ncbi:MAG: CRISPR-associated protein [Spirochaetes bacterium ADurb.Bin218]|nr:MAG: CRISPR-associated protein [Spirochaetes bacterium ADurb.Bin218]
MSSQMSDYSIKLKALLHDPIHKIWSFSNVKDLELRHNDCQSKSKHERVAYDLYNFLISGSPFDEVVKMADVIASGLTRFLVSPQGEAAADFYEESSVFYDDAKFIDCFTGTAKNCGAPASHKEVQEIFEKLGNLKFKDSMEREKFYFLFLWRFLPEIFPWINTHPADSRTPNHSIYDHLVQTSALASCLKGGDSPAFLLWTLGPVQSFIESAKKTSDLWAGSFLLSYLTFKAISVVMEEEGVDHLIFPNLNGQPLVDKWLYDYFKSINVDIECFTNWKKEWEDFFKNNSNTIEEKITIANIPNRFLAVVPSSKAAALAKRCSDAVKDALVGFAKDIKDIELNIEDIESFFNIYWVVLPWMEEGESIKELFDDYRYLTGKEDKEYELFAVDIAEFVVNHPLYKPKGDFNSQIGIAYSLLVEMSELILASRKNIRDFVNIPRQTGKKCSICGEYSAIPFKEDESLCSICALKRKLPSIMKEKLSLQSNIRFPSTSEMPTVKYKEEESLKNIAAELVSKIKAFKLNEGVYGAISVPKLKGNKLYHIDGQFLMPSTYRKEYLAKEYGFAGEQQALDEIKNFLIKNEIEPPVYYAILAMDGDKMGEWISGGKNPPIGKLLHDKAIEPLKKYWSPKDESKLTIGRFLDFNHPMTPSFHSAFSRRLSDFALNKVRSIVETDFSGKLIYAGGDDVLAFLPVEDAFSCAAELQKEFKNLFGEKGSMSAGIVFVHHKYPLQMALNEVRDAERKAKKCYGREACCLKLIKNSGESRRVGIKWESEGMKFFENLVSIYSNSENSNNKESQQLPSKFGYDFMDIVRELVGEEETFSKKQESKNDFLKKILLKELKRIYHQKFPKDERDVNFEKAMLSLFEDWQYGYDEFANMFIIARFIGRQGREV